MNRAAGVAVGIIVAVGALSTAGAWYTGTRLEGVLQQTLAETNRQLQQALPGAEAAFELVSLDRRLFGSTAHYRFHYRNLAGGEPQSLELSFTDDMEHGPFPPSRLKGLKLMPVMATSNYRLERTPSVDAWFALSGGNAPLTGQASIGYDQAVTGTARLAALDGALDDKARVSFSGMDLDHHSTRDAAEVKMEGASDRLRLETVREDGTPIQVELTGLHLTSDQHKGPADLYLGDALGKAERLQVSGERMPAFDLRDLTARSESRMENDALVVSMTDDVGMLNYDGQDVGAARLAFSMRNLDPAAVKEINELYAAYLKRLQAQGKTLDENAATPLPDMTAEERTRLHDSLGRLLAVKPVLALDELSLKTAHGEGRFNLSVALAKPTSFDLPADRLAREIIQRLDSRLGVAKATLEDLAGLYVVRNGVSDPAKVAQQAQATRDKLADTALSSGLVTLQGNDLVTSVAYADGQVDFNGKRMPLEQIAPMLMGMAMSQAGALPSDEMPEGDVGDEAMPDEDADGE